MSKYTTEVRFICETVAGHTMQQGYHKIDDILTVAAPKVFSFDFPIFDEDYRLGLEKKILRHFYTREISEESVGLWKLRLEDRMNVIMPYYNQLYNSELIKFNPLYDTDLTTTEDTVTEGNTTSDSEGTSESTTVGEVDNWTWYDEDTTNKEKQVTDDDISSSSNQEATESSSDKSVDKYSDTPQGSISNLEDGTYLTNARIVTDTHSGESETDATYKSTEDKNVNTDGSGTKDYEKHEHTDSTSTTTGNTTDSNVGTSKTTEEYIQTMIGKRSLTSYSKYLNEFRDTFLNIDNMVINELNDLFFNLW